MQMVTCADLTVPCIEVHGYNQYGSILNHCLNITQVQSLTFTSGPSNDQLVLWGPLAGPRDHVHSLFLCHVGILPIGALHHVPCHTNKHVDTLRNKPVVTLLHK